MSLAVVRADGEEVLFEPRRLADAVHQAARDLGETDRCLADELVAAVVHHLEERRSEDPPRLEVVQNLVEQVLQDCGRPDVAQAFRARRQQRAWARAGLQVRRRTRSMDDATDVELMVDPLTHEELIPWERERIATALQVEAGVSEEVADEIATAVEEKVFASNLPRISTGLIRALVDNELFERDLVGSLAAQQVVGMPGYDLERLIHARSRENSTVTSHNPEAIGLTIAGHTLRRFALREIFSSDVAGAHLEGRLHLHGVGQALRLGAVVHDLSDLLRRGLDLRALAAVSAPARHAATVTGQLQTYLRAMGSWFAGPQGVAHLNLSYAPFLEGLSEVQLYQEAQQLLYATAQHGGAGGGKALAVDFNIVLEVPAHLRGQPLVGPGGQPTERPAEGYLDLARRFARALLRAWGDGDLRGAPFPYPRCVVHLPEDLLDSDEPAVQELLELAAQVAAHNGSPIFHLDRDGVGGSFPLPGHRPASPSGAGASAWGGQMVTLNLPRAVLRARAAVGDGPELLARLREELRDVVDLAIKGCAQRRQYLMRLASSPELPLWELGRAQAEGGARVDFSRLIFHVGVLGLAEAVEMLEPPGARSEDLPGQILETVKARAVSQGEVLGLLVRLVEAPCESASRRLARIDLREAPEGQELVVRGDRASGNVYYTRGSCQPVDAPVSLRDRLRLEGRTQAMADGGAQSEVHPRRVAFSAAEVLELLRYARERTGVRVVAFSPLLLVCGECRATHQVSAGGRGRQPPDLATAARCPECYSYETRLMTRIAGYLGVVADANPSRVLEVDHRRLGRYEPLRRPAGRSR